MAEADKSINENREDNELFKGIHGALFFIRNTTWSDEKISLRTGVPKDLVAGIRIEQVKVESDHT